ncbi:M60 family peptidase N-terminal accessory domain-containing protein [Flavobacterium sp.]|uniref:M60 family peptidase N-terminal accessory domain-containing protein n=1 Tax=Flavobacterium sp. TaxID=239 RepID=UPI003751A03E
MKKIILLLLLSFNSILLRAQIASYAFENNLNDSSANHHASYIENGNVSNYSPTYLSGISGQNIQLGPTNGVLFPLSLNNQINTSTSLEIQFTFSITDLGPTNGWMSLMSNQSGANDPGFSIYIYHDQFNNSPNYEVIFAYSDGGFNLGVPDHPGHEGTPIGIFNEGELVNLKLIFDFQNNKWISLTNGTYKSLTFNQAYDINVVKNTITQKPIYISWEPNQEQAPIGTFTSTGTFDNIKFYSPRIPSDTNALLNALQAMTAHLNNSIPLSLAARTQHLNTILLNYQDSYVAAQTEIYNYITAYETGNNPMFSSRTPIAFTTLPPENQLLIFLQQDIHDHQFIPANIVNMSGIKFEAAQIFPGTVSANAPRVNNAIVDINGTYQIIPGARIASDLSGVKRPTGYYAAPGEIITITIPSQFINSGIIAMIGAHDSDLSARSISNRFVRISKDFPLNNTTTQIANPFGGAIYLKFANGFNLGWFQIGINGAVKSPYFSSRTGRETSITTWQNELASHYVQWADLESDKFMMTLPLNHLANLNNPTSLLNQWDAIMDGINYVGGRPLTRARSEYFLIDSRLPADAFGTGYPQVIGEYNAPNGVLESTALYPTQVLNPNFYDSDLNITFHEMGHNAAHPTLITEVETIVHLNAVYVYNQLYAVPLDQAFKYSSGELFTLDEAAIDWIISANFRNNNSMSCDPTMSLNLCDELRYQHRGYAKYIDMVNLFGWSSVHGMNQAFYDDWSVNPVNQQLAVTPDTIIKAASDAVGVNMAPLMHFWGLIPSPELQQELASMPESNLILQRLIHYKQITPNNVTEFQPWYNNNVPKKDPVHLPRYNYTLANYDNDTIGQEIKDQIDFLIETYFHTTLNQQQNNLSSDILIYPNPSNGVVNIKNDTDEMWNVNIFNITGQKIYTKENIIGKDFQFEFTKPAGVYIVEISTANKREHFRLINNQ